MAQGKAKTELEKAEQEVQEALGRLRKNRRQDYQEKALSDLLAAVRRVQTIEDEDAEEINSE